LKSAGKVLTFNRFNVLYGPVNGLYGILKNVAEGNLTENRWQNLERKGIKELD